MKQNSLSDIHTQQSNKIYAVISKCHPLCMTRQGTITLLRVNPSLTPFPRDGYLLDFRQNSEMLARVSSDFCLEVDCSTVRATVCVILQIRLHR